jgi:sugar phosphate isomerase/epimerase
VADGAWTRREFLSAVSGAAAAALPSFEPPSRRAAEPPNRPIGIQLYSVRDALQRDFAGTLAALAGIGYAEVEFAGLHDVKPRDVRRILDDLRLRAPGGHYGLEAVTDRLEQTIAEARALGHSYVIVPWLPDAMRSADGYARTAELLNRAGERLGAAGLRLGYHNHAFEFAPLGDTSIGYDILLARTDPRLVVMELDLYWIRQGGRDALDYFRRHQGRFRCVHVKDMAPDGAMVDVGAGVLDWPALLAAARKAGVQHFFTEHDHAGDPMAFARNSYRYLSRLTY